MKYFNFKRYKFSTILKNIHFKRNIFFKAYKSLNINRFDLFKIYKYLPVKKYNFTRIYKYIDIVRGYNFLKTLKSLNIIRLFNSLSLIRLFRLLDLRRYNFLKILKYTRFKKYKSFYFYSINFSILGCLVYLIIPFFFNYEKSDIEKRICNGLNVKCYIEGNIKYSFFPSPRLKINDLKINNFLNKNKTSATIGRTEIKISLHNLLNKKKQNFTKIYLTNAKLNFDLNEFKELKNFYKKIFILKSTNLQDSEINFLEGKKKIASIYNVNFKYRSKENSNKAKLKGNILGNSISINYKNKKNDKNIPRVFIFKMPDLKLFSKVSIFNTVNEKKSVEGKLLFKKNKSNLSTFFAYKNNQIVLKNADLRNVFLNGNLDGVVSFYPFFNFDMNVDLKGLNFNRFATYLERLNAKKKKDLFRFNRKINGQLNLSSNKIYTKHNLVDSFESRLKFINGNISVEQLLLNLGKIGAADITGIINNDKKYSTFAFENNIFIDSPKHFFNKFGVHNIKDISTNLFTSGNFNLSNLSLNLREVSNDKKFEDADVLFIENEFNNVLFENGYKTFFNYLKLREFIRSAVEETN